MGETYTHFPAPKRKGGLSMRKAVSLFDVLKCVIDRNRNEYTEELHWEEWSDGTKTLEFDPCEGMPIDDAQWMLRGATDNEAKIILRDFVAKKTLCGWSLNCQMARLLSEKGQLVAKEMDRILEKTDWESYASPQLLLSYLAVKPDGAKWAYRLLDVVFDDARDGLFLACWKIKDKRLHAKLLRKFEEWFTKDATWGGCTGEDGWLGRFVSKWLIQGTFSYARLVKCIRWHFKHMVL